MRKLKMMNKIIISKKNEHHTVKKVIDLQQFSNQEIFNFMDNGIVDYDEED